MKCVDTIARIRREFFVQGKTMIKLAIEGQSTAIEWVLNILQKDLPAPKVSGIEVVYLPPDTPVDPEYLEYLWGKKPD
jgi:hypothetical protein